MKYGICGLYHGHLLGIWEAFKKHDPDFQAVGICEVSDGFQKSHAAVIAEVGPVADLDALLAQEPDVILTSHRNDLKPHLIARCAKAGVHVFADKPLCVDRHGLRRIRKAAKKIEVGLALNVRQMPAALTALGLVRSGAIGEVFHSWWQGPHRLNEPSREPWFFREDQCGGLLVDIGCHSVDLALEAHGAKVVDVDGRHGNFAHPKHPSFQDHGEMHLTFANGSTADVRLDWFTPGKFPTYGDGRGMIFGTKGTIEIFHHLMPLDDPQKPHEATVILCNDSQPPHKVALTESWSIEEDFLRRLRGEEHHLTFARIFEVSRICIEARRGAHKHSRRTRRRAEK
ncbi:MAG: Gfo/Idh/MocA family protein [Planctomycetota bacterium]